MSSSQRARPDTYSPRRACMQRLLMVLVLVITGACLGGVLGHAQDPTYTAKSYALVVASTDIGLMRENNFAQAYGDIATSPAVLERAVSRISMARADLASALRVSTSPDAPVIELAASSEDPGLAAAISNASVDALVEYASGKTAETGFHLSVFTHASTPQVASSLPAAMTALSGAAVGLIIGVLFMLGRQHHEEDYESPLPEALNAELNSGFPHQDFLARTTTKGRP